MPVIGHRRRWGVRTEVMPSVGGHVGTEVMPSEVCVGTRRGHAIGGVCGCSPRS